jgi:hypothetical protein
MRKIIATIVVALLYKTAYNQCQTANFSGLNPNYTCPEASQLFGNPIGGSFQGPGISGDMFSPAQAGLGTHVISYSTAPSSPSAGYLATPGQSNNPANEVLTTVFLGDDELSTPLPIGFSFNFFGVEYTDFVISSNGYITFDLASLNNGCCSGQNIPENFEPNNLIALAWNDLNPSSGGIIGYTTIGTAPNRILIVSFADVPHFGSAGTNITVQAKLYESNGNIEIHCTSNISDGTPHTVGVENASGSCGITALGMNANPDMNVVNEMILFTQDAGSYYGHQTGLPTALHTGTLNPLSLGNETLSSAIPLGFSFDFYGTNYSETYISSNGFLTFSNNQNAGCCAGDLLPNTSNPNNTIAFAWNDLNPALGGTIGYTTTGMAPNRTFILDFTNIQHNGGGNPVTAQVKLFETSNLIEIHSVQNTSNGSAMTMGIENAAGTEASVPVGRNANTSFNVLNERTIFYPYYTMIQTTEVINVEDLEAPVPFDLFPITISAQCVVNLIDAPFAEDNCSGFTIGTSDVVFPITESTTITWTFTDAAGNSATTSQEVIIDDTQAPVASGFIITITAQTFVADEVLWTFTDNSGNIVASGGPYFNSDGQGTVLETVIVTGTNGPYSFMGTTAGNWNDNVFSFTITCQGITVASGTVNAGQTTNVNTIAACNSFADIVTHCELLTLNSVTATDNCMGSIEGTHNAVFPITTNTTVTWTFDDGNGNITTQNQNIVINEMSLAVNIVGSSLVAAQTGPGVSYSWVNCDNNFEPIGGTNQAFTPTQSGSYAVIIQIGECSKMSECIDVTLGIEENNQLFTIHPNPAQDFIFIDVSFAGLIELTDFNGKVIMTKYLQHGQNTLSIKELPFGAYIVRMIGPNHVQSKKLIIAPK